MLFIFKPENYPLTKMSEEALFYMQNKLKLTDEVIVVLYECILALNDQITPKFSQSLANKWAKKRITTTEAAYTEAINTIQSICEFRQKRVEKSREKVRKLSEIECMILMMVTLKDVGHFTDIAEALNISLKEVNKIAFKLLSLNMVEEVVHALFLPPYTSLSLDKRYIFRKYEYVEAFEELRSTKEILNDFFTSIERILNVDKSVGNF